MIDDAVFRQARKHADRLKTTLSSLVEQALRAALAERAGGKARRKPFKLIVNKGPGLGPGHSWDTVAREVLGADRSGLP